MTARDLIQLSSRVFRHGREDVVVPLHAHIARSVKGTMRDCLVGRPPMGPGPAGLFAPLDCRAHSAAATAVSLR